MSSMGNPIAGVRIVIVHFDCQREGSKVAALHEMPHSPQSRASTCSLVGRTTIHASNRLHQLVFVCS